jgi:hypothetical protein
MSRDHTLPGCPSPRSNKGNVGMSTTTASFVIQCWQDLHPRNRLVRVVRIETEQTVPIATNSYLLRFMHTDDGRIERCYIRHIASGREAYLQGGPGLSNFVCECVLNQIADFPGGT